MGSAQDITEFFTARVRGGGGGSMDGLTMEGLTSLSNKGVEDCCFIFNSNYDHGFYMYYCL